MTWKRAGNLGTRLKDVREAVGRARGNPMTQEEMGELMGLTAQSVSDAENGRTFPSRSRLVRLAGRLGIPVAAFAEGGPMPSTLPLRPVEPQSPDDPGESLTRLLELEKRLRLFRLQLQGYAEAERRPGPAVIAEWLELLADLEEAKGSG